MYNTVDASIKIIPSGSTYPKTGIIECSIEWCNAYNLVINTVILAANGKGRALVTEEPLYLRNEVNVLILEDFEQETYLSGEWGLTSGNIIDVLKYIPENYKGSDLVQASAEVGQDILNMFYESVRLLNAKQDKITASTQDLIDRINDLGFVKNMLALQSDYTPSTTLLRVLLFCLKDFYERNGTKYNYNLLRYVNNSIFEVYPLWTNDYVTFVKEDEIPDGATDYYLTSRIWLQYNARDYDSKFFTLETLIEIMNYILAGHICIDTVEGILRIFIQFYYKCLPSRNYETYQSTLAIIPND